ncbi:MAG: hypothetical protein C00003105_01153 [ANME-2 cluster archaeon HR1]|nr:MAG: hypothetical protein C00003105_01153 [ANME-2 cluster archaeon HR1]
MICGIILPDSTATAGIGRPKRICDISINKRIIPPINNKSLNNPTKKFSLFLNRSIEFTILPIVFVLFDEVILANLYGFLCNNSFCGFNRRNKLEQDYRIWIKIYIKSLTNLQ